MATVLIFLCNVQGTSEDVCLNGDDFKEAKEAHDTGYSKAISGEVLYLPH